MPPPWQKNKTDLTHNWPVRSMRGPFGHLGDVIIELLIRKIFSVINYKKK